jgi:phage terminase small subunit
MGAYEQLNVRRRKFVDAYLAGGIGSQAVIAAGYQARGNSAEASAVQLLRNIQVQAALEERRAELRGTLTTSAGDLITVERVLQELALIAFADLHDFVTWDADRVTVRDVARVDAQKRRALAEVAQTVTINGSTIRVKLHNKLDALEKLGKHLGLFPDKLQIELLEKLRQLDTMSNAELEAFLAEVEAYGRKQGHGRR